MLYSLYFDLNIWFRARKVTGTFEKRAPGPDSFSCRHVNLSGIVWTPIRYVNLLFRDRRGAALFCHRNIAEITVLVCEQNPYLVCVSYQRKSYAVVNITSVRFIIMVHLLMRKLNKMFQTSTSHYISMSFEVRSISILLPFVKCAILAPFSKIRPLLMDWHWYYVTLQFNNVQVSIRPIVTLYRIAFVPAQNHTG